MNVTWCIISLVFLPMTMSVNDIADAPGRQHAVLDTNPYSVLLNLSNSILICPVKENVKKRILGGSWGCIDNKSHQNNGGL